jgi:hypothetical protein
MFVSIVSGLFLCMEFVNEGACGSVVVKALFYKPEAASLRPDEVNDFFQFI